MKNQKTMGNKGFSLVELIVVIAIMAVLVGVLAPQFIKYVEKSKQSTDLQNIQQMKTAIEVQAADGDGFASNVTITIKKDGSDIVAEASVTLDSTDKKVKMKSSGWQVSSSNIVCEYDVSTNKWKAPTGTTENGKDPKRNIADIFK